MTLLTALRTNGEGAQFFVLAMKQFIEKLRPYLGANQEPVVWPTTYRWYQPRLDYQHPMTPRWRRLQQLSGPLASWIRSVHDAYSRAEYTMGPRARALSTRLGLPAPVANRAYRLYRTFLTAKSSLLQQASHERLLRKRGVQVVHFPYPLHFSTSLPFIYEPWGLPHLNRPELYSEGEAEWMERLFRHGCHNAAIIVVATRWIKNDIVCRYAIKPEKIAVIPRRPDFVPPSSVPLEVDSTYQLPSRFALFPAMTLPLKNHIRLIQAIHLLRIRYGLSLPVICTGRHKTAQWPAIEAELERLGVRELVRFLGPIPYSHLAALYRRAGFLVFPSLFEGLGLPLLEAFHYGLPVVAASAACIPEVVGDAALLFDPCDVDNIAAVLRTAAMDPEILSGLPAKGTRRLAELYPDRTGLAKMFVACYRKAARVPLDGEQLQQLQKITA
jgi:glycosyltransferase involved in cell wall biosynthesis